VLDIEEVRHFAHCHLRHANAYVMVGVCKMGPYGMRLRLQLGGSLCCAVCKLKTARGWGSAFADTLYINRSTSKGLAVNQSDLHHHPKSNKTWCSLVESLSVYLHLDQALATTDACPTIISLRLVMGVNGRYVFLFLVSFLSISSRNKYASNNRISILAASDCRHSRHNWGRYNGRHPYAFWSKLSS